MQGKLLSLSGAGLAAMLALFADASISPAQAACVQNVASWDVLWMRSGPGVRYRRIGSIPPGACGVRIYWQSCRGNWCRVRYAGRRGWANTLYLHDPENSEDLPVIVAEACVRGVADRDVLWVRSGPSTRYRRVGSIAPHECGIQVHNACRGNWCLVITRDRVSGWVNTRYLNMR